jgi:hypothetical protein
LRSCPHILGFESHFILFAHFETSLDVTNPCVFVLYSAAFGFWIGFLVHYLDCRASYVLSLYRVELCFLVFDVLNKKNEFGIRFFRALATGHHVTRSRLHVSLCSEVEA